jgi:mannose-1-phosphate guanylyltransferase
MQRFEEGIEGGDSRRHRWGVILAGGDGTRLLPLTRKLAGDDRPKQFCAVMGIETLLSQTRRRISRLVPQRRTLVVLTSTHEPFYGDQIDEIPSSRLVIQPSNQGTAPAIVYSLVRLGKLDPEGIVAFFPSDHYFADDASFIRDLDSVAYTAAAFLPEMVVLLGIPPEAPEVEYGWIEPGIRLDGPAQTSLFAVERFWEKPHQSLASALMARGCLWNTFIMVGRVSAFLNLIRHTLRDLLESFESIRSSLLTVFERTEARDLYSGLHATGFSRDVLSARPNDLAVLRASGLGWSDLGKPSRVLSALERQVSLAENMFRSGNRDRRVLVCKQAAND